MTYYIVSADSRLLQQNQIIRLSPLDMFILARLSCIPKAILDLTLNTTAFGFSLHLSLSVNYYNTFAMMPFSTDDLEITPCRIVLLGNVSCSTFFVIRSIISHHSCFVQVYVIVSCPV